MDKLKPCPFCETGDTLHYHWKDTIQYVICGQCDVMVDIDIWDARPIVESVNNAARYKEALESVARESESHYGCRCSIDDVSAGDCWPCRMMGIADTARNALNIKED